MYISIQQYMKSQIIWEHKPANSITLFSWASLHTFFNSPSGYQVLILINTINPLSFNIQRHVIMMQNMIAELRNQQND